MHSSNRYHVFYDFISLSRVHNEYRRLISQPFISLWGPITSIVIRHFPFRSALLNPFNTKCASESYACFSWNTIIQKKDDRW